MHKCANPECEKEIPNESNYCSEECLRQHIEIKKPLRVEKTKEVCKNCGKEVKQGLTNFCSKSCLDEYKLKQQDSDEIKNKPEVKAILERMRIFEGDMPKFGFRHWVNFITFLIEQKNKSWDETYNKLRSVVGVDYRYIDDYVKCAKAWGIININGNILHIIFEIPKTEKSQSFKDYIKDKEVKENVK